MTECDRAEACAYDKACPNWINCPPDPVHGDERSEGVDAVTDDLTPDVDLVAWLREQLDDDERIAWAVPDHRKRRGELHWHRVESPSLPGLVGDQCGNVVTGVDTGRWHAEHIALHDPARALAEVAAKRKIIAECEYEIRDAQKRDTGDGLGLAETMLRLLALPYAGRPGWRTEWKP